MTEKRPFVAVVVKVPVVASAVVEALEAIADVRTFRADSDIDGLLTSLQPDAVVVDDDGQAELATAFAQRAGAPLLHVSLHDDRLRVLGRNGWNENVGSGSSPDGIRNALAGALYGRER